uniref:TPX2 central domain-containing protein n=1 Tax=Setaria digitata TaxID=48799 RepID=A0A915PXT1_9BILA
MCDDDSFNVATVPRHSVFGGQADSGNGDDESTLGDRFFDLLHLQTDTVAKSDISHCMPLHDKHKRVPSNVEQQFERISAAPIKVTHTGTATNTTDQSAENLQENVPFELNRLAMFRPPSRTRLSSRRSNTVLRGENAVQISTCTVELSHDGILRSNGSVDKEIRNRSLKVLSNSSNPPTKTLRCNVSRPSDPTQARQRSLDRELGRVQPAEVKRWIRSTTCQPAVKVRAASAEPRVQRPLVSLMRTNGSLGRKVMETGTRIRLLNPYCIRSASTDAVASGNAVKAKSVAKTNGIMAIQSQNGTACIRTDSNSGNVVSNVGATRKFPYMGPETRARAKMKQSNQVVESNKISSKSTMSTPKRSTSVKSVHSRPPLFDPNVARNAVMKSSASASSCKLENLISSEATISDPILKWWKSRIDFLYSGEDQDDENGRVSRPRTRITHGPIRIRNTKGGVKGTDGLPPIESESRFRQSLTRRAKGGDSLDRDVTRITGKENEGEVWTVIAKKPEPVSEFAPCLRNRVAAKATKASTPSTHAVKVSHTSRSKAGGTDVLSNRRRRTEEEREAFFRRLSTPKTITATKKCTK